LIYIKPGDKQEEIDGKMKPFENKRKRHLQSWHDRQTEGAVKKSSSGRHFMSVVPVTSPDLDAAEVSWFAALCSDDYQFLGVPEGDLRSSWEHCSSI
jgi:hypothetical protein